MFSRIFLILITFDSQISKKDRRGKDISRKILTPFDFNILYFFPDDVFFSEIGKVPWKIPLKMSL